MSRGKFSFFTFSSLPSLSTDSRLLLGNGCDWNFRVSSPLLSSVENGSRGVLQDPLLDDQKGRSSKLMKLKFSPGSFLSTGNQGNVYRSWEPRILIAINESRRLYSFMSRNEEGDPASSARWKGTRLEGGRESWFLCICVWKISPPVWIEVGRKGKCEAETSCRENRFSTSPPSPITQRNS